ncbi:MAG TPA: hypothetical protein VIZ00_04300 [Streptosporangiaceae bacterium]
MLLEEHGVAVGEHELGRRDDLADNPAGAIPTLNSARSRIRGAARHPDSDTTFAEFRGAPHARQLTRCASFWNWHHEQTARSTSTAPSGR